MAVIIPIHSGGGHSGSNPPAEYVISYLAVALIVWVVVAVVFARHEAAGEHRGDGPPPPPDKDQLIEGVIAGFLAAVAWPISLVAASVWQLVRRLTRPRPAAPEEGPGTRR